MTHLIPWAVIVICWLYKRITIFMIIFIRFSDKRQLAKWTQWLSFVGIQSTHVWAVLLINANIPYLQIQTMFFLGQYDDFTYKWHLNVGYFIIVPLVILMMEPFFTFILDHSWQITKRLYNRRCTRASDHKTTSRNAFKYCHYNTGLRFNIGLRYAQVMNIAAIAIIFGFGLPILIPIAFCILVLYYFFEKILVVYYYRKSAFLDSQLSNAATNSLKFSVVFYLLFAFWMVTNPQMFANKIKPIYFIDEKKETLHHFWNPGSVYGWILLIFIPITIIAVFLIDDAADIFFQIFYKKIVIDGRKVRSLPNYYDCVGKDAVRYKLAEEHNQREKRHYKK